MNTVTIKNNKGDVLFTHTTPVNSIARTVRFAIDNKVSINNANLTGADLTGVDFSHLRLRGIDFTNANLTDARFYKTVMKCVVFHNTNLTDSNLEDAIITYSGVHDVNFTNTFAKHIHIIDCCTSNWNLTNAVFRNAGLVRNRSLKGSKDIYDNTDLRGCFARQDPILHPQVTNPPHVKDTWHKVVPITNSTLEEAGYIHIPKCNVCTDYSNCKRCIAS